MEISVGTPEKKEPGETTVEVWCTDTCLLKLSEHPEAHSISEPKYKWTITHNGTEVASGTETKTSFTPTKPSKSIDDYEVTFEVTSPTQCDYSEEPCTLSWGTKSANFTVARVKLLSIDAVDPEKTKAKYELTPNDITLNGIFKIGGVSKNGSGLSGNFEFEFSQTTALLYHEGNVPITLEMDHDVKSVKSATCKKREKRGQTFVFAYFLYEGGGLRKFDHSALERSNYDISYSVPFSGKTTYLGTSHAGLVNPNWDNPSEKVIWTETHRFSFETESPIMQIINSISPSAEARILEHEKWVDENPITATAKCAELYSNYGSVFAHIVHGASITMKIK